jgi:hypothetical protein
MKKIIILFLCICNSQSCFKINNKKEENNAKFYERIIGSKVEITDSLTILNSKHQFLNVNSLKDYYKNDIKILTIIEADCPKCISNIKNWERLVKVSDEYKCVDLLFVMVVDDTISFFKYIYPKLSIHKPIIIDYNHFFVKKNPFAIDYSFRTLLLNKNFEVVLYGDPTWSDKMDLEYRKYIGCLAHGNANSN